MIALFLIDTSGSMNQRTENGFTFLDLAKSAVERFVNIRLSRNPQGSDRYLLVTCADNSSAIKVGWKDGSPPAFLKAIKNLAANDLSDLGGALKRSFDLLNQYRLANHRETYGHGRHPWKAEPATIILITDGSGLTSTAGNKLKFTLPSNHSLPGSHLTTEPFRWDQRLFSIQLQVPGLSGHGPVFLDPESNDLLIPKSPLLGPMCEATGGNAYFVENMAQLMGLVDTLATKLHTAALVVNFTSASSTQPIPNSDFTLLQLPSNQGLWPIPEENPIDYQTTALLPRKAQPTILVAPTATPIPLLDHFPSDPYLIEPCRLSEFVLKNCPWQSRTGLSISLSGAVAGGTPPIGFLSAASPSHACCYLLPFDFPRLFALLNDYRDMCMKKVAIPIQQWRASFEAYLHAIPPYYIPPLKQAVAMWAGNCVPTIPAPHIADVGPILNPVLQQSLQDLIQEARLHADHKEATRHLKIEHENETISSPNINENQDGQEDPFNFDQPGLVSATAPTKKHQQTNRAAVPDSLPVNVFDIPRTQLLEAVEKLRGKLYPKGIEKPFRRTLPFGDTTVFSVPGFRPNDSTLTNPAMSPRFNLSIAEMGNFQEFLNKQKKLRPLFPDEDHDHRNHFGSPFRRKATKKSKKNSELLRQLGSVDEAERAPVDEFSSSDESEIASPKGTSQQQKPLVSTSDLESSDEVPMLIETEPAKSTPLTIESLLSTQREKMDEEKQQKEIEHTELPTKPPKERLQPPRKEQPPRRPAGSSTAGESPHEIWAKSHAIHLANQKIRQDIWKALKKPGAPRLQDIDALLSGVVGDAKFKTAFLNGIIAHAKLWNKQSVVTHLAQPRPKKLASDSQ